jgi:hypothetical protein
MIISSRENKSDDARKVIWNGKNFLRDHTHFSHRFLMHGMLWLLVPIREKINSLACHVFEAT